MTIRRTALALAALLLAAAPLAAQTAPEAQATRLEGFNARRERGNGRFVTREDVERTHPAKLVDLLRGISGVRVVLDEDGNEQVRMGTRTANRQAGRPAARRTAGSAAGGDETGPGSSGSGSGRTISPTIREQGNETPGDCPVVYYLDGVYFPLSRGESINNVVPARAVEGIEIYQRAGQVPSQFVRQGTDCGVIVIWTRRG